MNILPANLNFNFIAYSKSAFKISTLFIIIGIILFFIHGIKSGKVVLINLYVKPL